MFALGEESAVQAESSQVQPFGAQTLSSGLKKPRSGQISAGRYALHSVYAFRSSSFFPSYTEWLPNLTNALLKAESVVELEICYQTQISSQTSAECVKYFFLDCLRSALVMLRYLVISVISYQITGFSNRRSKNGFILGHSLPIWPSNTIICCLQRGSTAVLRCCWYNWTYYSKFQ